MTLAQRNWVPDTCEVRVQDIARKAASTTSEDLLARVQELAEHNRVIHEEECFNLNPATNVINPKAEALLSSGIGSAAITRGPCSSCALAVFCLSCARPWGGCCSLTYPKKSPRPQWIVR